MEALQHQQVNISVHPRETGVGHLIGVGRLIEVGLLSHHQVNFLGCISLGISQIELLNPKNGFFVYLLNRLR